MTLGRYRGLIGKIHHFGASRFRTISGTSGRVAPQQCWPQLKSPPDVYPFATHLARRIGANYVIDLGCGTANQLDAVGPEVGLVIVGSGTRLNDVSTRIERATYFECDMERPIRLDLPHELLASSVIVCSNVIERLLAPRHLLRFLARCAESGAVTLISTAPPFPGNIGQRDRSAFFRRPSTFHQLDWWPRSTQFRVLFDGLTANDSRDVSKGTLLSVCEGRSAPPIGPAPAEFRVLAIVTAYNEADIIQRTVGALLAEGVEVHLIDNWSTDGTLERALSVAHLGRFSYERFPPDAPEPTYRWSRLLERIDAIAALSRADWCIHHDADERRSTPWSGVGLRDGLHYVQQCGYNAVDHTLLNFWPVDNTDYRSGDDPERHFRYFSFGESASELLQIKAWKNGGDTVRLADWGGHSAEVKDRRVFPYNFLIKHYSIRSQAHGEQKVFRDRIPRWDPAERANGWHVQYDHVVPGYSFVRRREDLMVFDASFERTYLIERLSHGTRAPISRSAV